MFYDLFGPLIFTVVKLKRRPAFTSSVSFGLGSCPFTLSYSIPFTLVLAILKIIVMHVIQIKHSLVCFYSMTTDVVLC